MAYYKFNPKNHICSLVWTTFCLYSGIDDGNLLSAIAMPTILGVPTVVVGINMREKSERDKRRRIVNLIRDKQMITVGEVANLLNIPGTEARELLSELYKEERINMINRDSDMAVVYTPIN